MTQHAVVKILSPRRPSQTDTIIRFNSSGHGTRLHICWGALRIQSLPKRCVRPTPFVLPPAVDLASVPHHCKVDEPKIDPFIGLGLGYNVISCSISSGAYSGACGYSSGIYAIARAGARYIFSPKMAVYGDVGAGGAAFNVGIMFKMN